MNLILLEPTEVPASGPVELSGRRAEHIIKVLGCKPGDLIRIGVVDGARGHGRVLDLSSGTVTLAPVLDSAAPPAPPVDLILALPRPIMLRRILSIVAAMGVGRVFLVNARRVEKSFFAATIVAKRDFRGHLLLGLEQAMDTRLPQVSVHDRFRPFVEDELSPLLHRYDVRLFAHPGPEDTFRSLWDRGGVPARIVVAIGPEGGWIDYERDRFLELGFVMASCGPRVLRVDTAVAALLSRAWLLMAP